MMKNVLAAMLVTLTAFAASVSAADAPRTSSTTIQFTGRVVEDSCAVTVGHTGTMVTFDRRDGLVPVDVTFRDCDADIVPSFRLVTETDEKGRAVLSTDAAHTSVRFYHDEKGTDCVTAGENLLGDDLHRETGKDRIYRAMWAKLDGRGKRAGGVRAVAVVEIAYD